MMMMMMIKGSGYFVSRGDRGEVDDCRNGQGPRTQLFKIISGKFFIILGSGYFASGRKIATA